MECRKIGRVFSVLIILWSSGCAAPPSRPQRGAALHRRDAVETVVRAPLVLPAAVHRVAKVRDGDSLMLLSDGVQHEVRLAGIDAPELRQEFGTVAKSELAALVQGKEVTFTDAGRDAYHRNLVRLFVNGTDVNLEMVRRGLAWQYRAYSNDAALMAAEQEARKSHRGVWSRPRPVPPWEWRRRS